MVIFVYPRPWRPFGLDALGGDTCKTQASRRPQTGWRAGPLVLPAAVYGEKLSFAYMKRQINGFLRLLAFSNPPKLPPLKIILRDATGAVSIGQELLLICYFKGIKTMGMT